MSTNKQRIYTDQSELIRSKSTIETAIIQLNELIKSLPKGVKVESVSKLFNDTRLNYDYINEIAYNAAIEARPEIKSLGLSKEKNIELIDFVPITRESLPIKSVSGINYLLSNPSWWTLKNNTVQVVQNFNELITDAMSCFAETETEIKRLDLINQMIDCSQALHDLCPDDKRSQFDFCKPFFMVIDEKIVPFDYLVKEGHQPLNYR